MANGKAGPDIEHKPLPAQQRFERLIERVLTSTSDQPGVFETAVPPTGAIYLNCLVRGRVHFRFRSGARAEAPDLYFGGQLLKEMPQCRITTPLTVAGLKFTATGFHRLFRVDASRLTDRIMPLDDIDARLAAALRRALAPVQHADEAAEIMQDALAEKRSAGPAPGLAATAAGHIERTAGRLDVAELAETCAASPRHLRRVFSREVGVSPKAYAKIVQLNTVVAALRTGEAGAVHDLALAHGYYDQAHFARDFSRLVGSNPGAFLASREAFLEMFLGRNGES